MSRQSRTVQQWFDEYGVSHQNKTNKLIHWVMVPIIFLPLSVYYGQCLKWIGWLHHLG